MEVQNLHAWDLSPQAAVETQRRLADMVRIEPLNMKAVQFVAGSDMSYERTNDQTTIPVFAGFVTLALPGLTVFEEVGVQTVSPFPYMPGLLSFRETPPLLEAWKKLRHKPDALLVDGQGLAHPRRFGLACHLGVLLDLPTIGVAKTLYVGEHEPVGENVGDWMPLWDKEEIVGAALRTRRKASPVFVSVGHRVDLRSALALVLRCLGNTRVPETTRQAHEYVNRLRRNPELLQPGDAD